MIDNFAVAMLATAGWGLALRFWWLRVTAPDERDAWDALARRDREAQR